MAKIAIVGAGSVEFTRNIVADLSSWPELRGAFEIALHDIDPERLAYAEGAARALVERTGAGHAVTSHPDRRSAFEGTNYMINEIQVGGYRATRTDFDIPTRYGLRQTIADTIGIGGILRGLRTIPVVVAMAEEMAELCPGALILNYTNPMAMVPWGVWAGSSWPAARTIGVCHSVRDTHSFLAETVGVPEERVEFRTAGFNHQCFVYVFRDRETGRDLYPRLREIVLADPEGLGRRVRVELFKRFGYFPTESSEHSAEYVPWFLHHDDQVERFRVEVDEYLRRSDENLAEFKELKRRLDTGEDLGVEPTHELASQFIHALETGEPADLYGNVRNEGLVDGLAPDACVEVPVRADGDGVHPTRIGEIPSQCLALNRTFENVAELTVRAAVEGSRDLVYQAALLDPNTAATLPAGRILDLVDELIVAHGELIPEPIRSTPPMSR
ncbi:MAG: alpha-galactosidase [Actinomycetota bacterium]